MNSWPKEVYGSKHAQVTSQNAIKLIAHKVLILSFTSGKREVKLISTRGELRILLPNEKTFQTLNKI